MTEAEWLEGADATPMLKFISNNVSPRKERLFACECCRLVADLMPDPQCAAAEVAERFADHLTDEDDLFTAWEVADRLAGAFWESQEKGREAAIAAILPAIACDNDGSNVAYDAYQHLLELTDPSLRPTRLVWGKEVVRCIFGNPFRPAYLDPSWRTPAVLHLAQAVYDDRAFDQLPILADALEEAGCASREVLGHLRSAGPHARGCWPLDLILGRA